MATQFGLYRAGLFAFGQPSTCVAAEHANVRHARVAVHSVSFEEVLPRHVDAPLDALRTQLGLAPDQGASLRNEPVFSSFPASLDAVVSSPMRPPFRAREPRRRDRGHAYDRQRHRRAALKTLRRRRRPWRPGS